MVTNRLNIFYMISLSTQKNMEVYDTSARIAELELTGAEEAVIDNLRQALYSILAVHNSKVSRRRKQIELAVKI